jgi:hypothetical protein
MSLRIAETTSTPSHTRKRNVSFPLQNSALKIHLCSMSRPAGENPYQLSNSPVQLHRTPYWGI